MDLLHSPLHSKHLELGAKMAEFGGWSMPLEYGSVVAEHTAVREKVGVFDVSHLGKVLVRGTGAAELINSTLTNDINRIRPGQAQYTLCCDETGGVVDDLIIYLRSEYEVFLIPNAANTTEVVERLKAAAPEGIEVINQHREFGVIAIQGPLSDEVLHKLNVPLEQGYMSFAEGVVDGVEVSVCRTGYTGERGYELVVPAEQTAAVWDAVFAAREEFDMVACGLGARDTLRTEMGYPLHGHELSLEISPVMARAAWAVGWNKPEFWGKAELTRQRAEKSGPLLRGLRAQGRGIPRPGMKVLADDGTELGEITSGTFSPTLRQGIGLALLQRSVKDGDVVSVQVRNRVELFDVVKPPFVEASTS